MGGRRWVVGGGEEADAKKIINRLKKITEIENNSKHQKKKVNK